MFAYLEGRFVYKSPALVHLDVNGIGYELQVSLHTYSRIQHLEKGLLFTHLLIREDAHMLFGFFDKAEKEMFLHLIGVSGIGASTGRVMLSYMPPGELARAIISGNTRELEAIKGIGKKTAERIVLELRDKLAKNIPESNIQPLKHNTLHADALNALMALGIPRNAADTAIQNAIQSNPSLTSLEDLIKNVLKSI